MPHRLEPRSRYLDVQGREMHVTEWGEPGAAPLVMWHGLARTGRDFDPLAAALADRFHILCPDTLGRGLSQWARDPDAEYCLENYAQLATGLVEALGLRTLLWVGTSMGGALGIRLAATSLKGRILRLVVNDIGPTLPEAPKERIRTYVGNPPEFATMRELESYFRTIYAPFGAHTDAQWRHMAETSARRLPSGALTTHYDPAIVRQLFTRPLDYEQWELWNTLSLPVLVLRGAQSDLLLPDDVARMRSRGPSPRIVEIEGCGHAPALNVAAQIAVVADFLAPGACPT